MKRAVSILMLLLLPLLLAAQRVSIHAVDSPASVVFRQLIEQTGKNFVYSSDVLQGLRVTISAHNKPLKQVLAEMFRDTGIEFKIKGNNVILKRGKKKRKESRAPREKIRTAPADTLLERESVLREVVVLSRLDGPAVSTSDIGATKLTAEDFLSTPALFGENDVIKTLQLQPGIVAGTDGLAGMNVHGGNADQNLWMLDNVPLYQVNHFAGLFSAFNPEAVRYIDFFKSSIPAKYEGRLSSYLDVRTKSGSREGHHGTIKIGLTSAAFNIDGPIARKTTYSVAMRRSFYELLSIPLVAIMNSSDTNYKTRFHYSFTDLNAKITHRFSADATAFASFYFGNDLLKVGSREIDIFSMNYREESSYGTFHWGNLLAQAGLNYRLRPSLTMELTAAYTHYFSRMKNSWDARENSADSTLYSSSHNSVDVNIHDGILRGDFDWRPNDSNRVRFGGGYTFHSFLPMRADRRYTTGSTGMILRDSTRRYSANEMNLYIEDDLHLGERLRANAGLHLSVFGIDGKTHFGWAPRLSVNYSPAENWAVKGAYARTNQYVYQLTESYLSLPTDQWVPITGDFKPLTADKVSLGGYWQSESDDYAASVEGYFKSMHNLIEYRDEYYLRPPGSPWNSQLCSGKGSAKGLDFYFEKRTGRFTGRVSYSLAWANRTFADKNGGKTFPARFDNRHTINILLNWHVNDKVSLNAAWIGHSGNRITLHTQVWESPHSDYVYSGEEIPLQAPLNNYRLPFYHRLDLACVVKNRRGYWTFSLYNAYCHLNTIGVRRAYDRDNRPVFQKVKLLPVIPSISYTWQF